LVAVNSLCPWICSRGTSKTDPLWKGVNMSTLAIDLLKDRKLGVGDLEQF
jgi:hypothetical protein